MQADDENIRARRARVAAAWNAGNAIVLVGSGTPQGIPGTDQHHPFRPHPAYRYLTEDDRPGRVLAFDAAGDGWVLFAPRPTADERIWEAAPGDPGGDGRPRTELAGWLAARAGRPVATLGVPPAGTEGDAALSRRLRGVLDDQRRRKDPREVAHVRQAAAATAAGFAAARAVARPGVSERAVAIELEHAFRLAGGDGPAFDTIVAGGPNASVLHFSPTARALAEGELVLVDAGTSVRGYAADVTRTWSVSGSPTAAQRDLHALVLEVQQAAIAGCRPGREYRELHLEACVALARGLVDLGLLRGDAEGLVERDAHALFFPHGLGHLLGLAVHDVGGYAPGREPSGRFGLRWLRTDLPLEAGMVVTVEPGLYFIDTLLDDAQVRERHARDVDWARVDALRGFGGIRIEDDVLVTADAPEILTDAIPRALGA